MAGRTAAAGAECLRQIRDRKLYKSETAHLGSEGVNLDGEVIPLTQENSQRIAAAVLALRRPACECTAP